MTLEDLLGTSAPDASLMPQMSVGPTQQNNTKALLLQLLPMLISGGLGAAFGGKAGAGAALTSNAQMTQQLSAMDQKRQQSMAQQFMKMIEESGRNRRSDASISASDTRTQKQIDAENKRAEDRLKAEEARQKALFEHQDKPVEIPQLGPNGEVTGQVDRSIAPALVSNMGASQRQAGQQKFEEKKITKLQQPFEAEQKKLDRQARLQAAAIRGQQGQATADDINDLAEAVKRGEMEVTAVPVKSRGQVVGLLHSQGFAIVPKAQREIQHALDSVNSIVDDIEKYSQKINTESGISARTSGMYKRTSAALGYNADVKSMESKKGELAPLVRNLFQEKGNLSEGDVERALSLIPTVSDTKQEAANKLGDIRKLIRFAKQKAMERIGETYGQGIKEPEKPQFSPNNPFVKK